MFFFRSSYFEKKYIDDVLKIPAAPPLQFASSSDRRKKRYITFPTTTTTVTVAHGNRARAAISVADVCAWCPSPNLAPRPHAAHARPRVNYWGFAMRHTAVAEEIPMSRARVTIGFIQSLSRDEITETLRSYVKFEFKTSFWIVFPSQKKARCANWFFWSIKVPISVFFFHLFK